MIKDRSNQLNFYVLPKGTRNKNTFFICEKLKNKIKKSVAARRHEVKIYEQRGIFGWKYILRSVFFISIIS